MHGIPHFGFAEAAGGLFVTRCIFIVRMNLQRKFFFRENKFREQRKDAARRNFRAGPFDGHFGPRFSEFLADERAVGEAAFRARHPSLADRFGEVGFFREKWRERFRTPWTRAENRIETRRANDHAFGPKKRAMRRSPSSMRSIEVA